MNTPLVVPLAKFGFFLGCALAAFTEGFAAPGDLDPTFGVGGKVTTSFGHQTDSARSLAIQSDGKILVAGAASTGGKNEFEIARYSSDGTLDTSFNGVGWVSTSIGLSSGANTLAVQSDGKIVVGGSSSTGTGNRDDFALARYNTDGSLDTSFNGTGSVTTGFTFGADESAADLALQSNGKIVVVGQSRTADSGELHFGIARYNSDGSLDTSFSGDGIAITQIGLFDAAQSVAVQSDGKIVVAGTTQVTNGPPYSFALVRYNTNGTVDFKKTTPVGAGIDNAYSVAVQTDGKIVVAGNSYNGFTYDFALVRYNADGSLDSSFSGDGKVTTDFTSGTSNDTGYSVAFQTDGKIVVAGGTDSSFAVARYNIDGSLDTSFSGDGKVSTAFGDSAFGYSVALQSDGKIVVAGQSGNDFAVVRYEGVPEPSAGVMLTGGMLALLGFYRDRKGVA